MPDRSLIGKSSAAAANGPFATRRDALKLTGAALAALGLPALADEAAAPADPLTLWYRNPADEWVEALPVGNGRLGAMVFGGIALERLQLNEDTLWSGGPYESDNPAALAALPKVRELIFAGRYAEAEALANESLMGQPERLMSYQPMGDLLLSFGGLDWTTNYRRELQLDDAIARTEFQCESARHRREVFASTVDQVIVMRVSADTPGSIDFDALMSTPQQAQIFTERNDTLVMSGRNLSDRGVKSALVFETRLRVIPRGGRLSAENGRLSLRGADEALLLLAAATNYQEYGRLDGDPAQIVARRIERAAAKRYETLRDEHRAEHQRLFRRVSIDLGSSPAARWATDERVQAFANGGDPALAALYFQYGRYLLISSSRAGTQPANLQGIWNDRADPPWGSKYTININTEMNYWPAEPTHLPECVWPLVRLVRELSQSGARIARRHYGASGWVAHHNTDLWRAATPVDGAQWGLWPMGGAWLCRHLWDHYDYSRDRAYLADVYPLMKGAAQFFVDTLLEHPRYGWLVTNPSLSPENVHPHGATICAGPSMDSQILRDLFAHCIEAAGILGLDRDFREQLAQMRERLPPHQIGEAGQLQEWIEDWDMAAPEIHHRHVSHLYAVYPSEQINVRDTPKLAAAARRTLEIRGGEATGWGIGWRLNLWARLGDGEQAYDILRRLLAPRRTYPNLFDAHPPFQIDGNFGGTAGITEMLMQSWGGEIHLLPALPAAWPQGSVRGLRVRGAATIDVNWREGRLREAVISSERGGKYRVRYGEQQRDIKLRAGQRTRIGTDEKGLLLV